MTPDSQSNQTDPQDNAKLKERAGINMLWVGCISIVMIFAGLTSAFLVVKSDNFWVRMDMPGWFVISTVVILLSSLTFFLALRFARQDKKSMIKLMMALTVVGGIAFTYSQFKGWGELIGNGYHVVGKVTADGYYGQHVMVAYKGKNIDSKNADVFEIDNEPISAALKSELDAYFKQLFESDHIKKVYNLDGYEDFTLIYKVEDRYRPISFEGGSLKILSPDGVYEESPGLATTIKSFSRNMVDKRGYFMMAGDYGADFEIEYRGTILELKNNNIYAGDNMLSQRELAALEDTQNTASSFTYILSGLHLLHLLGGWIYILVVFVGSIKEKYGSHNYLKIKLGSIYWHFLGGLWIFLYLFLTFIH